MSSNSWVRGSLILVISNILSRILGLGRDALLSRAGGIGIEVDAYNLAFLIPDMLNHVLGAGLLSVTLIPLVSPFLQDNKKDEAMRILESIFSWVMAALLLLTVFSFVFAPHLLSFLSDGPISPELTTLTTRYTRIILFAQICFVAGGFFNAWQYMHYRYFYPALAPLFYNGGIIIGGAISLYTGHVEGFCWGVLAGAISGPLLLQWWAARKVGWNIKLRFIWVPEVKKYLWMTLPFALGVSMTFSNEFLFRYFGASDPGGVSALGYGLRMTMAIVGVLGGAVGIAAYPYLSELCAKKKYLEVNKVLINTLLKISILVLPVLPMIWWLAPVLVKTYLGTRIGEEGIELITQSLRAYLWVALPMSLQMIVSRVWYADQRTWRPAFISLFFLIISFPFYKYFADLGPIRIPIIGAITCFVQLVVLVLNWSSLHKGGPWKQLLRPLSISLILAGGVMFILSHYFDSQLGLKALLIAPVAIILQWVIISLVGGKESKLFLQGFVLQLKRKLLPS